MFDWTGDYSNTQTRQSIVNKRVRGSSDLLSQAIRIVRVLPGQGERSWPEHDVTEGIMMLADDKWPEATLLIGLSYYALQC